MPVMFIYSAIVAIAGLVLITTGAPVVIKTNPAIATIAEYINITGII